METIPRRKGSNTQRRSSVSRLFNKSTAPTFQGEPTRFYNFNDTPVNHRPASPLCDRQKISPEIESAIRYACSLLFYRVEKGVPSLAGPEPSQPAGEYKHQMRGAVLSTQKPQINSKYYTPKVDSEVAAMKDKHDSGVGLTQQPSRQTMRHLKSSHSDKPFNSDEPRLGSSSRQARCTTSSSKTGHLEGLNSSPPPTSHQEEDAQHGQKDQDTVYLLTGASNPYTQWSVEEASDDVEVFLNPDAPLESSDAMLLSSSSPSFGLPNRFSANRQSQLNAQLEFLGESTGSPDGHYEYAPRNDNQPGVIIDSNGLKHILTTAEEVQRDAELRNAVMAKMGGAVGTNPASPSFPDPTTQGLHQKREAVSSRFQPPQSSGSKTKSFKWRDRSEPSPSERTVFDKITGFFKKRKDTRV